MSGRTYVRYSNFLLPKLRRIQIPRTNATRRKLESSKSSRSLEMHRDLAKEMLERLFTLHKTEWENFMGFPCPGSLSLNWECEA